MADRYELSAELMTRIGWYYDPVIATGLVTFGILAMFFDAGAAFCFLFFGALYLLLWWWLRGGLKRIEIAGNALYISDFLGRRDAVHLANVTDVAETGLLALKKIKLTLDADTRFGRIVEFLPTGWRNGPWRPHPIATYLQERVAAARVGIPPRLPAQEYAESAQKYAESVQKYAELQADMRRLRETEDKAHSRR